MSFFDDLQRIIGGGPASGTTMMPSSILLQAAGQPLGPATVAQREQELSQRAPVLTQAAQQALQPAQPQQIPPQGLAIPDTTPSTGKSILNALSVFVPGMGPALQQFGGPGSGWGTTPMQAALERQTLMNNAAGIGKTQADTIGTLADASLVGPKGRLLDAQATNQNAETALFPVKGRYMQAQTRAMDVDTDLAPEKQASQEWVRLTDGVLYNTRTKETRVATPEEAAISHAGSGGARAQQGPVIYDKEGKLIPLTFVNGQYRDPSGRMLSAEEIASGTRAEDGFQKYRSRAEGGDYDKVLEDANTAQQTYQTASTALNVIESSPDVYFGTGGETVAALRKGLVSMGFSPNDVTNVADADVLRALGVQKALSFVNQTKGAVSDREMSMFMEASPSLANTREGNTAIWKYTQGLARRQMERGRFFAERAVKQPYGETLREWQAHIEDPKNSLYDQYLKPVLQPKTAGFSKEDEDLLRKYGH